MAKKIGRPSVFAPKDPACRYQGVMTTRGGKVFEQHRATLAKMAKMDKSKVSDADVFEFLARGLGETSLYLEKKART